MPAMRPSLPLAALVASLANACTLIVIDDALAPPSPCTQPGDCAAGHACTEGTCQPVETSTVPPPVGTVLGPAGGDVIGPDEVLLAVPSGALADDVELFITRESNTNVARACEQHSAFYRVTPELDLAVPAVLSIPVAECDTCVVCAAPQFVEDPWVPLDEPAVAAAGSASALVTTIGVVVVAGVAP